MAYSALLDANVLHPQILCDLLLRLAEHDAFRPLWSARILEETIESIRRRRPDLDRTRLQRRMDAMSEAFPDACVTGYERLIPTMPEMGEDAHVLAAALHGDADVIVTDNEIWFLTLYDKDEATDLSQSEKRLLKAAVEEETRRRATQRRPRRS